MHISSAKSAKSSTNKGTMKSLVSESRKLLQFALVCAYHSTSLAFSAPFSARSSRAVRPLIGALDRRQCVPVNAVMMSGYHATSSACANANFAPADAMSGRRLRIKALQEAQEQFLGKDVTLKADRKRVV